MCIYIYIYPARYRAEGRADGRVVLMTVCALDIRQVYLRITRRRETVLRKELESEDCGWKWLRPGGGVDRRMQHERCRDKTGTRQKC